MLGTAVTTNSVGTISAMSAEPVVPTPRQAWASGDGLARVRELVLGLTLDDAADLVCPAGWGIEEIRPVVSTAEGRRYRMRVSLTDERISDVQFG